VNTPSNDPQSSENPAPEVSAPVLREAPEPTEKRSPLPFWIVVFAGIIVFWGGFHLASNSGGFKADVYNPALAVAGGAAQAGPPDPKIVGKRLYTQNCVVCHQASGLGVAGQFPPLVGSEWVVGGDWVGDNHLVKILLAGIQGPMQVKGNNYNNAMPPWAQLKDEEIAGILTFIRSEWGNAAPPITPEFVAKVRADSIDRKEPWTQKELKEIPAETQPAAGAAPAPAAPAEAAAPAPAA
jgi:mono/diheme cytochrome c family protein